MVDIVSPETRSKMMSGIKGKDTKPELLIRKQLFSKGFRYRLHVKDLPGKPDLVLKKYQSAIFINGCFWHRHECSIFKWPRSRKAFWEEKLNTNSERDNKNFDELLTLGWRVLYVWECSIRGANKKGIEEVICEIENWLHSDVKVKNITENTYGKR